MTIWTIRTITPASQNLKEELMDKVEWVMQKYLGTMRGANQLGSGAKVVRARPLIVQVQAANDGALYEITIKERFVR